MLKIGGLGDLGQHLKSDGVFAIQLGAALSLLLCSICPQAPFLPITWETT